MSCSWPTPRLHRKTSKHYRQNYQHADRGGGLNDPGIQFSRAYWYGKKNYPNLTDDEQIWRAAKHQIEKFSPGGYGRRTYFPETETRLNKIINPIIKAYQNHDLEFLKSLVKPLLHLYR